MRQSERREPVWAARDRVQPVRALAGEDPISGYFVAQTRRPGELWDVDVFALTPYQRALLTSDGTVTRLVEASALEPLTVDVLDQRVVEIGDEQASLLELPAAAASIVRRRVAITGRQSIRVHVLAESFLVSSRLPRAFTRSLSDNPKGLGEVIDQLRLETRRELLWFGYATPPGWAKRPASELPLLTRSYRIIIAGAPAILITEHFSTTQPQTVDDAPRRSFRGQRLGG